MNRHDGVFHFRYWTSKTDHYTKSYPDFSLGGSLNSGTQFRSINKTNGSRNTLNEKTKYFIEGYELPDGDYM